uniref:NADH-ubiquinone oxidoreductase chain 5 n=1 Tax=Mastigoproctus giganteus TaxID=58767 RepID=B1Q0F8_MASGI|nr:NADH dehydrogenase subunit 5 [Mastigoproctus giganteus]
MLLKWGKLLLGFSLLFFVGGMTQFALGMEMFVSLKVGWFEKMDFSIMFIFDYMGVFFVSFIMLISGSVMIYSEDYMSGDVSINRFGLLVILFVLSMSLFVFSYNLFFVLLGWDGLGLVSYCLVIYYQNPRSFNSGMITVLTNRIGDVGLLMSIACFVSLGDWMFTNFLGKMEFPILLYMILIAAITKSAQIPFSAWLPAAMAAPTPVSALVHSSTLVTAGVFLLIRFNFLFSDTKFSLMVLFLSMGTLLLSSFSACFEMDLKKVVALSTLSQLSVMIIALSCGLLELCYFHLMMHALFKAMLFLCVGVIIHGMMNNQDLRNVGGLNIISPIVSSGLLISGLALSGFPFLAGFYSKDLILEEIMFKDINYFLSIFLLVCFVLTASYSFRLNYYLLWKKCNFLSGSFYCESNNMNIGILVLSMFSIMGGALLGWMLFPMTNLIVLGSEKFLGLLVLGLGLMMGVVIWVFGEPGVWNFKKILSFYGNMWYINFFSTFLNEKSFNLSKLMVSGDKLWGEMLGGQSIYFGIMNISVLTKIFHKMKMTQIFLMVLMVMFFMLI